MKRIATATTLAAALVLAPATAAQAGPADRATKELQQENEEYRELQRTPAYQQIPDCCVVGQPYSYADIILGVTFAIGLVVLW